MYSVLIKCSKKGSVKKVNIDGLFLDKSHVCPRRNLSLRRDVLYALLKNGCIIFDKYSEDGKVCGFSKADADALVNEYKSYCDEERDGLNAFVRLFRARPDVFDEIV